MKAPIATSLTADDLLPYQSALRRWALRQTPDRHFAEDLVQETFLHALSRLHEVRDPERLGSWIFRIAERRFIDALRRASGQEQTLQVDPPAPDAGARRAVVPESPAPPGGKNDAQTRQEIADLHRAVRLLPASLRLPVRLHYIQGRPLKEVARKLGTTVAGAKSRLYRARRSLRKAGLC
ncbi:MAG: RNA polymerase sigma factor [Planctomycetota bacterium]|jgi:RNA polymerase sigma-70 factor (ECF subfamily)